MRGEVAISLREYCIQTKHTSLLLEWNTEKNGALSPDEVGHGSHKKVWWKCRYGHEWQAPVYARVAGSGCPYCSGTRTMPGVNDLATQCPDLVAEWHPIKNGVVKPSDIQVGSNYKAWWVCKRGHEWQASVKSRTAGSECPVCTNRKIVAGENDLASAYPNLTQEWHPTKNGAFTPKSVGAGSHKKVWWLCKRGHEWQASIASRTGGSGCPVCAGKKVLPGENDLATQFPAVATEWHPEKNGRLTPQQVLPYSNRRVWWVCSLGHEYKAQIGARTNADTGCPYCAGRKVLEGFNDLKTTEPELAAQWHPTLNETLTPAMVTIGSHKKVWWVCPFGHVWKAEINSRAGKQKCGCPVCAGHVSSQKRHRYAIATEHEKS